MKIILVGGGAANLVLANLLSNQHEVIIVDKKIKLGHKLSMTGNGKCNIAPKIDNINAYNQKEYVSQLFKEIPLDKYLNILNSIGVPTKLIKNQGYYPCNENASFLVSILMDNLKNRGVKIINDNIIDYQNTTLKLEKYGLLKGDKIVFATGGCSYPDTGSDGQFFAILNKHNYKINPLKPSLTPIIVKENIKSLFGARSHALLTLVNNDKVIYQEEGEIMFKKDALSGIAIMNMSSFISHQDGNYSIKVDFLNNINYQPNEKYSCLNVLLGYVPLSIAQYILKNSNINGNDLLIMHKKEIENQLRNLTFHVSNLYGFASSQVTNGGLDLSEIDENMMSKKEKDIYFIGEMLDIDGLCGGYNLRFALTSAMRLGELFNK